MLIVSQEGDVVVNFDNVSYLWIDESSESYDIRLDVYCHSLLVGEYRTFDRAFSVLKEVLSTFKECNAYGSGFIQNDIYYMPKE